jgi:hypothetical protein
MKALKAFIDTLLVMLALSELWRVLELRIEGSVQPRTVDDVMIVIFGIIIFLLELRNTRSSN